MESGNKGEMSTKSIGSNYNIRPAAAARVNQNLATTV